MSCLRVVMITRYPTDPDRIAGGIQAVSYRLAKELVRIPDLELHVVHCHSDVGESGTLRQDGLTVHFLAQSRRRLVPNMMTAIRATEELVRALAPDVVHAHGPSLAVAALQAGRQPLWTIHGILRAEARQYPGLFNRLSFALARHYERKALRAVRRVTAVNRFVVEDYAAWASPAWASVPAEWAVIENPAPPELFALPRRPVPGRVLVPATIIPLKDPLTLVRAAAGLRSTIPGLSVHLAGAVGDVRYGRQLRFEIAALGLEEIVRLLGPLDQAALYRELSEASVVALPSRQEVAPMAIVEAMAAAAPVVASAVGGIPYIVADGVSGRLVPPGDVAAWVAALGDVLGRPDLMQAMGMAGRAIAHDRFRPSEIARRYLAIYLAAAREKP
ncbi:MAG: glycosyltransferase family 4 protein [Anaerolineae bacterium]|nr:glycosyltransferase family 4 protein [Anaerolineae bacterium]